MNETFASKASLLPVQPSPATRARRRKSGGFSLVEITMAVGVVAFAFVSLMALLPSGMSIFRQAMDASVTAQIAQRLSVELQSSDFYTLLKDASLQVSDPVASSQGAYGHLVRRYYDDQGNEVKVTLKGDELSPEQRLKILYEVHIRVARDREIVGGQAGVLQGVDRFGSRNMATATIQIVNNPGGKNIVIDPVTDLIDQAATKLPVQSYPAVITRNGSEARNRP